MTSTDHDIDAYFIKLSDLFLYRQHHKRISTELTNRYENALAPHVRINGRSIVMTSTDHDVDAYVIKLSDLFLYRQHHKTNFSRINKQIRKYISTTRKNQWEEYCNDTNRA